MEVPSHRYGVTVSTVRVDLVVVVVSVDGQTPRVLAAGAPRRLPAGPLRAEQTSLQASLREFVLEQTGHRLGFVEQLYTFADLGRGGHAAREVSISYLGLAHADTGPGWTRLYDLLPWEDRRPGPRADAGRVEIVRAIRAWARPDRSARASFLWGLDGHPWRPELALQRYELLWEAGLVAESSDATEATGEGMVQDHRRIVATALSRLRATLQYRPVVFELMPDAFTLGRLQVVVEALAGSTVHTPNFRRLVGQHGLVEPTGGVDHGTGGRPARLYRFHRALFTERDLVGTKLPVPRAR